MSAAILASLFPLSQAARYLPQEIVPTPSTVRSSLLSSARQYVDMYRYGLLVTQWYAQRRQLMADFTQALAHERELFATFFMPGRQEYGDHCDWELRAALDKPDFLATSERRIR